MNESGPLPGFHAIVPAGGAGTRLWPLSRAGHPKFLLDLTGSGRTLIQQTVDRLAPVAQSVMVVTGVRHAAAVADQLPTVEAADLIAEPSPRDSTAAIALAAAVVRSRHPGAVVGSFAADHVIRDVPAFHAAVAEAVAAACHGWRHHGIPDRPCGARMDRLEAMQAFVRVVEAGSFTKAAETLRMNKTTVTQLIQYLEARLRVRLLNRTTRQVNVTAEGAAYYERVVRILGDIEESETVMSSNVASPRGRLRVDVLGVVARHMLLPAMPQFHARYGTSRSTWA